MLVLQHDGWSARDPAFTVECVAVSREQSPKPFDEVGRIPVRYVRVVKDVVYRDVEHAQCSGDVARVGPVHVVHTALEARYALATYWLRFLLRRREEFVLPHLIDFT